MAKASSNGSTASQILLENAIANLINTQAASVRDMAESNRVIAKIHADMATIINFLNEHSEILSRIPDAVRDKIGFKVPTTPS